MKNQKIYFYSCNLKEMRSKQIKKNLVELLSDSTAYGVPKIFKSKRAFLRKFWLAYFLIGFFVSIFFIYKAIMNYLDYEVITKIESIYEQPMLFPTISFCPRVPHAFDKINLNKIVKQCWFNLDESCLKNPENHFEMFDSRLGKCFRFNSGKNLMNQLIPMLNSTIGGRDDSFKLRLKVDTSLNVWIHDVASPPLDHHIGKSKFVSNSAATHLTVQKMVENKLGLPYNQCYKDLNDFHLNKTLIKYMESTNINYDQLDCLDLCYELSFLSRNPCNCTNTSLGKVWTDCSQSSHFDEEEDESCIFKDRKKFFKKSILNECKKYCPEKCDTVFYSVNTNVIDVNRQVGKKKDNQAKITLEFFVYFHSLKYTYISQTAKAREFDLVSNIGGIFGLFVGLSFVSLLEVSELFIETLFILYSKQQNYI